MMTQALDARVIIEVHNPEKGSGIVLEGISDETQLVKVTIHHWGTMADGSAFPYPVGAIAYMKSDANVIVIDAAANRFMVDRRLILGIE